MLCSAKTSNAGSKGLYSQSRGLRSFCEWTGVHQRHRVQLWFNGSHPPEKRLSECNAA
jgi:hypothetical protein